MSVSTAGRGCKEGKDEGRKASWLTNSGGREGVRELKQELAKFSNWSSTVVFGDLIPKPTTFIQLMSK